MVSDKQRAALTAIEERLQFHADPRNWKRPTRKTPVGFLASGERWGYQWIIGCNEMGYRCGYIKVNHRHPWFGLKYDDEKLYETVEVHGGLTYSSKGPPGMVPRFSYQWWLGFDCAHGGDAPDPDLEEPIYKKIREEVASRMGQGLHAGWLMHDVIRTQEYVQGECHSLIDQAVKAANNAKQCETTYMRWSPTLSAIPST